MNVSVYQSLVQDLTIYSGRVRGVGWISMAVSPEGVQRIRFGKARGRGRKPFNCKIKRWLKGYQNGGDGKFPYRLDPKGTDFQKMVWRTIRKIPRGKTRTYGWIANKIGRPKAVRAVGTACGANPLPIVIPCHRVVASNGLGGYSAGLRLKRRLLRLEGVV